MSIIRILPFVLLLCLSLSCERENGGMNSGSDTTGNVGGGEAVVDGLFSVSDVTKVQFAPGNLKAGGYGFTAHQYDYGGYFGWGTGNRPNLTSTDTMDYLDFYDWGTYNSGGNWRTLSAEEWQYLLFRREDARFKYGMATVWGVQGLILLPDNWTLPSDCTFRPGYGWRQNVYDLDQWAKMEARGAMFLPAAGYRWDRETFAGGSGYYWSSTKLVMPFPYIKEAYEVCFMDTYLNVNTERRAKGFSVSLVQEKSK